MATLKEPIKIFIVQSLACYDTPQEVADLVMQEYCLEIDRRQCENYDPFKADVNKLTPAQQEVEELTDTQPVLRLLDQKQVNQIIQQSETPEALAFNLMQLIPEASQSEFTVNLERALYTADVLGYVSASEEK